MKRLWIIEIWEENREVFKSLIEHIILFLMLIGCLVIVSYAINISGLHENRKETLETVDFIGILSTIVVLTASFLLKINTSYYIKDEKWKSIKFLQEEII